MAFQFFRWSSEDRPKLSIPALGLELQVKLPEDKSDGQLTILQTVNAPGFGPPVHRHRETEIFQVLEGRYLYEVNSERFECSAGDMVSVPGGDVHGFRNIGDRPARQLAVMVPAMDAQLFFTQLGKLMEVGKPSLEALNQFGGPWGVEFIGPPITL